jgi:hypothetical protein
MGLPTAHSPQPMISVDLSPWHQLCSVIVPHSSLCRLQNGLELTFVISGQSHKNLSCKANALSIFKHLNYMQPGKGLSKCCVHVKLQQSQYHWVPFAVSIYIGFSGCPGWTLGGFHSREQRMPVPVVLHIWPLILAWGIIYNIPPFPPELESTLAKFIYISLSPQKMLIPQH